jgi:hypothetical protein
MFTTFEKASVADLRLNRRQLLDVTEKSAPNA